ncbi:DUF2812 domain-containing protein [Priestia koreensis]|uniref:DUF2812 domain-containing protein n=1 Tax=Priestia koreensis TaxID=284581 RepID=UPI001F55E86B|nr:DUF2812 domain-containing protein [Priestia koreensis]UNL86079.1 DUF2812 domain-containing protein [Priestia koreensis]
MKKEKSCFRIFFAWQDEKEEQWLNSMVQKGWYFKGYRRGRYYFEQGEPADVIYKLDYKSTSNKDMEEYKTIFKEAGWEHVDSFLGWHVFKGKAGERFSETLYSDRESNAQKYKGLLLTTGLAFISGLSIATSLVFNDSVTNSSVGDFFKGFYTALLVLLGLSLTLIYRKYRRLLSH